MDVTRYINLIHDLDENSKEHDSLTWGPGSHDGNVLLVINKIISDSKDGYSATETLAVVKTFLKFVG